MNSDCLLIAFDDILIASLMLSLLMTSDCLLIAIEDLLIASLIRCSSTASSRNS